jgi:lipopolysaccharide transport system ATP-binding protein
MSSEIAIRAEGLGKAYPLYTSASQRLGGMLFGAGEVPVLWALRHVDLDLRRGEALGVVGRNGAGKSTLLKMIAGTVTPTEGRAQVNGRVASLLELGAGLHRDYTGRENARFSATIMGLSNREFALAADQIEAFADIGAFFDRKVSEYSSGMFARLAFSIAIHCRPNILIVDEILSVGDIAFQLKCLNFLRSFCAKGGALLFVSHDDAAVRALCNRAIWLDGGKAAAQGAVDTVLRQYHRAMWQEQSGRPFQISDDAESRPAAPHVPVPQIPADGFDPETIPDGPEGGVITGVDIAGKEHGAGGEVRGGGMVDLCVSFQTSRALDGVHLCFMLRNRLAQLLFGARTEVATQPIAAHTKGQARFRFRLPYLPTGDYLVEALVLARTGGADQVVMRNTPVMMPVRTVHISQGLANVAMTETRVSVQGAPPQGGGP